MVRLHLVGFTTDLKNLVFATRRRARSGGYVVVIDDRLRRTLLEVERLGEENRKKAGSKVAAEAPPRASKLTPKEIQALLRGGKSAREVAKLAECDLSWVDRFAAPILAEMAGVVDAVKGGSIQKPRLGPSASTVGDSIDANLREKRVSLPPEALDAGWRAVRRDGYWEVRFRYVSRGKARVAVFVFDPLGREVRAFNALAREIGWRPAGASRPARSRTSRPKAASRKVGPRRKPASRPGRKRARSRAGGAARRRPR